VFTTFTANVFISRLILQVACYVCTELLEVFVLSQQHFVNTTIVSINIVVFSLASRMLQSATQVVRMPCVCVWKFFFRTTFPLLRGVTIYR